LSLSPLAALGIFAAGTAAGAVNTVVGSGSLITFPALLAAGYRPLVANQSNCLGLVPGSVSGAVAYRKELVGQGARLRRLSLVSMAGGIVGAVLLLTLPESVFDGVVPVLVLVACVLVAVQPRLRAWLDARRGEEQHHEGGTGLVVSAFLSGVYGGYFGAAQGVILMALLSIFIVDDLQRLNGLKNVLAALVNGVAAALFVVVGHIAYAPAALLAVGSTLGGQVGGTLGRRLPPNVLRALIITVGVVAFVKLVID
jgi:uncharacterized protein